MKRTRLHLSVPKSDIEAFKKRAKAVDYEEYGILIGSVEPDRIFIDSLWMPEASEVAKHASLLHVDPQDEWFDIAKREARKRGHSCVGDIHSHVFPINRKKWIVEEIPSATDWNNHTFWPIMGICTVRTRSDRTRRASVSWWPRLPEVQVYTR